MLAKIILLKLLHPERVCLYNTNQHVTNANRNRLLIHHHHHHRAVVTVKGTDRSMVINAFC